MTNPRKDQPTMTTTDEAGENLASGTPAKPLTLDQLEVGAEYYGVKIADLGEDFDEGTVAFTHDVRRAMAAINRYVRVDLDSGPVKHIDVTTGTGWWVVVGNCGCGNTCPHEPDEDGNRWHEDCKHYGLPPCVKEQFGWIGLRSTADAPGAVPAITFEVSY